MTYTVKQLQQFTDTQIAEVFTPVFDKFIEMWNETVHPEVFFFGYYNEVVHDSLTQEQKNEWLKVHTEDGFNEDGIKDYDTFIFENEFLTEDVAEEFGDLPENKKGYILYTFKWMLDEGNFNDDGELIMDYLNQND